MTTKMITRREAKPAPTVAAARPPAAPPPAKRRVLLADDHPMTLAGLTAIISRQADLEVCGEATNPTEAMSLLPKAKPDLMVTDMTMSGRGGMEFLKDAHAMLPALPILVLSMHDESLYAERALRAGARGYLMKDAGAEKVLAVIRLVLSGQPYVSPALSERLLGSITGRRPPAAASPIEKLSDREFEVFQLLGRGMSTKEVARWLHLSPRTVDVHRTNIKTKLELKDAPSLLHHAVCWVERQAAPN